MQFTGIKETCLYVSDLDRTEKFYAGLLGLELISKAGGRHIFFRAGYSMLLCFIADKTAAETELPPHGAGGAIHFALEVLAADYDTTRAAIEAAGINITYDQQWKNRKRSFYFYDPDGHLAEIVEEGLWEQNG